MLGLLWGRIAPYVLGAVAIGAAVLGVLWRVFAAGRNAERAAQTERTLEAVEKAHEVDSRVAAAGDTELDGMRQRWTR